MRYFEIDGKQCRSLQFDKDLLGQQKIRLVSNNIFVRKIPKGMKHEELDRLFRKHGSIKSLKISLNSDHTSRGYGFICFQNEESANLALSASETSVQTLIFEPKDRR